MPMGFWRYLNQTLTCKFAKNTLGNLHSMPTFLYIANFFPSRNAKEAQEKNSLKKACVEKVCMKKLLWRKVVWWKHSRNEGVITCRKQRSKTGDETSFCSNFGAKTSSIPYYFHLFTFHTCMSSIPYSPKTDLPLN